MSRRNPRIIIWPFDVISVSDVLPGDFVYDGEHVKTGYYYPKQPIPVNLGKGNGIRIPYHATGLFNDPYEAYAEVRAVLYARLAYSWVDVVFQPSHPFLLRLFDQQVPQYWFTVTVRYSLDHKITDVGVAQFPLMGEHRAQVLRKLSWPTTVSHLEAEVAKVRQPFASLRITVPQQTINTATHQCERTFISLPLSKDWNRSANWATDTAYEFSLFGPLANVKEMIVNCKTHWLKLIPSLKIEVIMGKEIKLRTGEPMANWDAEADRRWSYYYHTILEFCLELDQYELPAYVVLWILDFHHNMRYWPELQRLECIESVLKSIKLVKQQRATTNKRIQLEV